MSGAPRTRGGLEVRAGRVDFTRRVYLPVQEFIQTEWIGSVLLLAAAVLAVLWANSPWADAYHHLWETELGVDLALFSLREDLHHWVNDGLMAVFFFVVGLEIKRELLRGNLSTPRAAAFPAVAALGGMVVPAAVYLALNPALPGARGWAIPMATDIAFALGVLGLLGRRAPTELRVFVLALAVVDDLGAIVVIALFYTDQVAPGALATAAVLLAVLVAMRTLGVRAVLAYALVGFLFWAAVLESGVHATLAGVILAALTPARALVAPGEFGDVAPALLAQTVSAQAEHDHDAAEAGLGRIEELVVGTESPLERMERKVHPWSSYVVLPLFALANAGVELDAAALAGAAASPVTLGVILGLVGGKLAGVFLASFAAVKAGVTELPPHVGWRHLLGAGALAGIGFTVSLFITELAFDAPEMVARAKMGVIGASLAAGVAGYLLLRTAPPPPEDEAGGS